MLMEQPLVPPGRPRSTDWAGRSPQRRFQHWQRFTGRAV